MFEEIMQQQQEMLKQVQRNPTATFQIKRTIKGRDILCQSNNLELVVEGFKRLEKEVEKLA